MSAVQHLREFIIERLAVAAGEIFSEFGQTIVQLEEEIHRQRRLLELSWKPQINLHRIVLPQHYVWNEEEVVANQQLRDQERKSNLEQEEAEPPEMKEEQDEPEPLQMIEDEDCVSQDEQQLVLKQETDTFMVTHPSEERDCRKPEANWDQGLSQNPPEAENQDQEGSKNEKSESSRDQELRPDQRCQQTKSPKGNVHNPKLKKPPETPTDLAQHHVWKEDDVLTDQQLWNQERNSSLDQNDLEPAVMQDNQEETEPKQMEEEQQELFISQDEQQFALKQETDTFTMTPSEGRDGSEPEANRDQPLSQNSIESDIQNQERSRNNDESNKDEELKHKRRRPQSRGHRKDVDSLELESHTGQNPHSCKTCGKSFMQKGHLTSHIRTHTGEKPYSCKTCGKCFSQRNNLTLHLRIHTGEKPYTCMTCGKHFHHSQSLTYHMKAHTGEKPFSCKTCGKGFFQRGHLTVHIRTHSGEKPFSCKTCGKCFSQRIHLTRHMRTHKG